MPIRYTSLAAALVVTNQKCPSHQPFMSTLPKVAYIHSETRYSKNIGYCFEVPRGERNRMWAIYIKSCRKIWKTVTKMLLLYR